MFQVQDARLGCWAIVDLGGSAQLVLGRADYRDGRSRAWLARVNRTGHVEWQHELPLESRQSGLSAGVSANRNGEAYVVGDMVVGGGGNLLLAKTRADGNLDWMKTLSLGLDTKAEAVVLSKGGAIVVGGFVRDAGTGGSVFIASFNASGDLSWQHRVAQAADQPQVHLRELQRGGYLVSGSFGVTYVDAEGRRQWEYMGIDVVAALEDRSGVVVISAPLRSQASGFVVHRLTADGTILSKQPALRDLCTIAGAWISEGERIVVAGNPCAREGELWISEVFDGGERNTAQISLPAGATAFSAERTRNGELVAVGMFDQDGPNALHGWFLKVTLMR
jgi:outer membrane protein assembly factor BamB